MLADLVAQLGQIKFQPANEKYCSRCDRWKVYSAFAARNWHSNGLKLQSWCKECHRQVNRDWYKKK